MSCDHKNAIRDVLLSKQFFRNKKHDERKLYILTEFIPFFDEKMETIDYEPSSVYSKLLPARKLSGSGFGFLLGEGVTSVAIVFAFLWDTVNKVDQKVQSFSHKIPVLKRLLHVLFALNSFPARC